jgi:hypothetical protein
MKISKILTIVFGVLAIGAAVFFFLVFGEYSHYTNDQEQIIQTTVNKAVEQQIEQDDVNFTWARKGTNLAEEFDVTDKINNPLKYAHFKSPEQFGSIELDYPLTWSAYERNDMTKPTNISRYDVYFDENVVTPTKDGTSHALHVAVEATLYEKVLETYQKNVDAGKLKAVPYVVPGHDGDDYTGVRLDGVLENGASGIMIILKTREKTMSIRCDIEDKLVDFEKIVLPSFQFIP